MFILYRVNAGPVLLILLTHKGSLCRGKRRVMINKMNQHQLANSEHILMTAESVVSECSTVVHLVKFSFLKNIYFTQFSGLHTELRG